jgi:hypothetical protein
MLSAARIKLLPLWPLLLLAGGAAVAASPAAGDDERTVVLWQLKGLGLDSAVERRLRSALAKAIARNPRWRRLRPRIVERRLERAGLSRLSPAAQAAPALAARFLLSGTVAALGSELGLDLKVLAGADGRQLRRASESLPAQPDAWAPALDGLLIRLLEPERWVGGLALEISEPGARVYLDGEPVATTPLAGPLQGLKPGKHILMIRKQGFDAFSQFVVVRYGQLARLTVDLANATVVGLLYEDEAESAAVDLRAPAAAGTNWQQVVGWSGLGLGAAAVLGGGLARWHALELEDAVERGWWPAANAAELEAKLAEGRRADRWARGLWIAGGTALAAGAAMLVWGLLAEPAAAEPATEPAVGLRPLPGGGAAIGLDGRF